MAHFQFIYETTDADGEMDLTSVVIAGADYRSAQAEFSVFAKAAEAANGIKIHVERVTKA